MSTSTIDLRAIAKRASATLVCLAMWLPISGGCQSTATTDDDDDSSSSGASCTSLPKVQGAAAECCPAHGADACGANLFCAAFDGRNIATCYVRGSQLPGMECSDDAHCATQSCDPTTSTCRGTLGTECNPDAGCVDGACYEQRCEATAGVPTAICDRDEHCDSDLICVGGRCGRANGESCALGDHAYCTSRRCNTPSGSNVGTCEVCQSDVDCQTAHQTEFEQCDGGRCVHTCFEDDHCDDLVRSLTDECVYEASGCYLYQCDGSICR